MRCYNICLEDLRKTILELSSTTADNVLQKKSISLKFYFAFIICLGENDIP